MAGAEAKAVAAIRALGRGFDVTLDLKVEYAKGCLIDVDQETRELIVPGNVVVENVSKDIKVDKGENTRFRTDVLDFHQMSERFNHNVGIAGKMPLGLFTAMFDLKGPWQVDALSTKSLAIDGYFAILYEVKVTKAPLRLIQEVKDAVSSTWQPLELTRFIEKYGTHVITGVKVGGKDVIYLRQNQSSTLNAADIQRYLDSISEQRFADGGGRSNRRFKVFKKGAKKKNVEVKFKRRGGLDSIRDHNPWLLSVPDAPEVVSMSFVPITALLADKPPIDELLYFLEFQVPRQWSPSLDPSTSQTSSAKLPALQFSPMGPKLHVATDEGKSLNRLSVHLQYLSNLPKILEQHWGTSTYSDAPRWKRSDEDPRWLEHVQWKSFSHINTAPVEYVEPCIGDEASAFIVTGAQLQVSDSRTRPVLFLRLQFTRVPGCSIRRSVWDHMPASSQKSSSTGFFSQFGFSSSVNPQNAQPQRFVQNSAVFSGGPSQSVHGSRLLKFVDINEMSKGIQDEPGHWIVTGAKLDVENGKICLKVKYSLLSLERRQESLQEGEEDQSFCTSCESGDFSMAKKLFARLSDGYYFGTG
ncbi:MACPF domain-containing protein CAD1 [Selaginella moellendorffii]|uniref:MACPF domain-containing protein CAD1 n=1 Tax=Selaginella moellendorffii TaxID=88036 RepID=UPI000D1CD10D|nr:MACPF domain-containing protein CAD1 [Selaginella moellendorffii]|eukprot:XP_024543995.1 MACPF domain-containing protein CAD1 [Selaginella moellendorffii]